MADAAAAFGRAVQRVPRHPLARLGRALAGSPDSPSIAADVQVPGRGGPVEAVLCTAAGQVFRGSHADAAQLVDKALSVAAPGNAAWLLPIEPLLNVGAAPDAWESALTRLRTRAA